MVRCEKRRTTHRRSDNGEADVCDVRGRRGDNDIERN